MYCIVSFRLGANLKILNLKLPEPKEKQTSNLPNLGSSSESPKKDRTLNQTKGSYFIEYQKMGKISTWYWTKPENYEP